MGCLVKLYNVKKKALMLEHLNDGMAKVAELLDNFKSANKIPTTEFSLLAQISKFECVLRENIPDDKYEEWDCSDYEAYTDKFYHRKYWNEIANDPATEYFLDIFLNLLDLTRGENATHMVSLYDFCEESLYFENKDDMDSFVNNYECEPYTAYELSRDRAYWEELYSA